HDRCLGRKCELFLAGERTISPPLELALYGMERLGADGALLFCALGRKAGDAQGRRLHRRGNRGQWVFNACRCARGGRLGPVARRACTASSVLQIEGVADHPCRQQGEGEQHAARLSRRHYPYSQTRLIFETLSQRSVKATKR